MKNRTSRISVFIVLAFLAGLVYWFSAFSESNYNEENVQVLSENPTYTIVQEKSGVWEQVYKDSFEVEYSTHEYEIETEEELLKIRVVQNEVDYADLDNVLVKACGADLLPSNAVYTSSKEDILSDIVELDNDVILIHEKEIEVVWELDSTCEDLKLFITANEYDGSGDPAFFGSGRDQEVFYQLGTRINTIEVDGFLDENDGIEQAQYKPEWESSSGHPGGFTHIYLSNDNEFFYLAMDITGDNTEVVGYLSAVIYN